MSTSTFFCSRYMEKELRQEKEILRPAYIIYKDYLLCVDYFRNNILINNVSRGKKS